MTDSQEGALSNPCLGQNALGSVSSRERYNAHPNHLGSSKKRKVIHASGI